MKKKFVMTDVSASDPRSFKAWKAGKDDGRTDRYLKWAKNRPNLSEMDLVERYRETTWEGEVSGKTSNSLLARVGVPLFGLVLGALAVWVFG